MLFRSLADGEAGAADADAACQAWRAGAACETWHAYQLIGDVLRSDDLAAPAGRDAAFLRRLRQRLDDEPVVLAPMAAAPAPAVAPQLLAAAGGGAVAARRRWSTSVAMAAGVLAVAGVGVMLRHEAGPGAAEASALAAASAATDAGRLALAQATVDGSRAPAASPGTAVLVRNAELDRYLMVHRQSTGRSLLPAPEGLRQAMVALPADH